MASGPGKIGTLFPRGSAVLKWGLIFLLASAPAGAVDLELIGPKKKHEIAGLEGLKKRLAPETITVWEPHEKADVTYVGFRANALFDALNQKEWRKVEDVVLT